MWIKANVAGAIVDSTQSWDAAKTEVLAIVEDLSLGNNLVVSHAAVLELVVHRPGILHQFKQNAVAILAQIGSSRSSTRSSHKRFDFKESNPGSQGSRESLREFPGLAREHAFQPLVVLVPYMKEWEEDDYEAQAILFETQGEIGVPYLDLMRVASLRIALRAVTFLAASRLLSRHGRGGWTRPLPDEANQGKRLATGSSARRRPPSEKGTFSDSR